MKKTTRYLAALAPLLLLLSLNGCMNNAPKGEAEEQASKIYYPMAPEAPRIQHLKTIASEYDLGEIDSEFAKFVMGDEKTEVRLSQPYGSAMENGRMYVADTGAGAMAVFDFSKKKMNFVAGTGAGRLKRPVNIRIDKDGTRYITDTARDQVIVWDRNDKFVAAFGEKDQMRPVDLAIVDNRLYVVDIQHHNIQVLDKSSGKLLLTFAKAGSAPGELFHPTNIGMAPNGDLLVVDTSNFRVQRFDQEGKFIRAYGEIGTKPGNFARPKGIALDKAGRMYITDAAFENVQLFNPEGKLLLYFGQPGDGKEGLNLPTGITIDTENISWFRKYAGKGFEIEYLIFVASQFGPNKIDVFGFGRMAGRDYPSDTAIAQQAKKP